MTAGRDAGIHGRPEASRHGLATVQVAQASEQFLRNQNESSASLSKQNGYLMC
jgi:hypothetical protein